MTVVQAVASEIALFGIESSLGTYDVDEMPIGRHIFSPVFVQLCNQHNEMQIRMV